MCLAMPVPTPSATRGRCSLESSFHYAAEADASIEAFSYEALLYESSRVKDLQTHNETVRVKVVPL